MSDIRPYFGVNDYTLVYQVRGCYVPACYHAEDNSTSWIRTNQVFLTHIEAIKAAAGFSFLHRIGLDCKLVTSWDPMITICELTESSLLWCPVLVDAENIWYFSNDGVIEGLSDCWETAKKTALELARNNNARFDDYLGQLFTIDNPVII